MKVQVNVKSLIAENVTLSLTAAPGDLVQTLKERVALMEPNPFPEQTLFLDSKALADGAKLSDCGIEEGANLAFEAKPTEAALAKQLESLLAASGESKTLPAEELGLLYALKHGVTVGAILQAIGKQDELLSDFLKKFGKTFSVENGKAKLLSATADAITPPQPLATKPLAKIPEDAAVQALDLTVSIALEMPSGRAEGEEVALRASASDTVGDVKARAAAAGLVPFAELELRKGSGDAAKLLRNDAARLSECGISDGMRLDLVAYGSEEAFAAQLAEILKARGPMSKADLNNHYCCRHGVDAGDALQMLGWGEKFLAFLQRHPSFCVDRGCVSLSSKTVAPASRAAANKPFLDLHDKLCADGFQKKVAQGAEALAVLLSEGTFLNVARAVPAGGAANGTAIPEAPGAEVVLFVEGLPLARQDDWLASVASSAAGALAEQLPELLPGLEGAAVKAAPELGAVLLSTGDSPLGEVRISFAPDYASYSAALAALKMQEPEAQRIAGAAAFPAQRARFVERLPEGVKATIRLLKWWRQRRQWSSEASRPSDELLELVAAHTAALGGGGAPPKDLAHAVAEALAVLARFDELNVQWPLSSRCYRETDVPAALLAQRPLILDPANPLLNVASAQAFDPHEVVAHASMGAASFFD